MRSPWLFRIIILSLTASVFSTSAQAQFTDLINRVPDRANALIALNLEKAFASPLAKKEQWAQERLNAFQSGMVVLPPQTSQFLLTAQLDFEFMQPLWEVAVLNVSRAPNMPEVAARWGGSMDNLGGRNAVVLPDDTYVVQFGPNMVGSMSPANRQSVGRWLRQIDSNRGGRLSKYLQQAAQYANKGGTPIIMAMDLQDVISPAMVKKRADKLDSLKGADVDIDQVAELLASARGLTLGITIKDRVFGRLKVDFDKDATVLKGIAKPLLLEILANNSASIDEFSSWKESVDGKTASIAGYLDRSGLRRLMSLIEAPTALQHPAAPSSAGNEESLKRTASQQYFKQVTSLVDDLRQKPNRTEVKTFGQMGAWLDRYSRKIDKLPMLNVDPDLLTYGAFVSDTMRQASDALKGIAGKSRVRELASTQYGTYGVGRVGRWGGWGAYGTGYDAVGTQMARTQVRTEERVSGTTDARAIMRELETATTDTRRKMVEKYNAEF